MLMLRRFVVVLVGVLVGGLVFGGVGASAQLRYPLLGQISGASTPQGEFQFGGAVAVDGLTGSVFVGTYTLVDEFGSGGAYEATWNGTNTPEGEFTPDHGVAANDSTGAVYVVDLEHNVVDVFSSTGEYLPGSQITSAGGGSPVPNGLKEPHAVAVDQANGDVFVADRGNGVVDVFSASGVYLSQITSAGGQAFSSVESLAVDGASGDLLVSDEGAGVVYVFDAATGTYVTKWTGSNTPQESFSGEMSIAADDVTGDVYVSSAGNRVVDQFTSLGAYLGQNQGTPAGSFGRIRGVAVGQGSGDVYVLDGAGLGVVDIFAADAVVVPDVSTGVASGVLPTSATLNGTVNPDGVQVSDCHFAYGPSESYGQSVPCVPAVGAGSAAVAVSAALTGLTPGVVYHFRLFAGNANGENEGQDLIFGPPHIDSTSASGETQTTVTLEAQIDPDGVANTARRALMARASPYLPLTSVRVRAGSPLVWNSLGCRPVPPTTIVWSRSTRRARSMGPICRSRRSRPRRSIASRSRT
jgi:hypothetical protein